MMTALRSMIVYTGAVSSVLVDGPLRRYLDGFAVGL